MNSLARTSGEVGDEVRDEFRAIVDEATRSRDKLRTLGSDAADAIFGPLIAEAELAALARERSEQRQIVASEDSTRAQVGDAQKRLLEIGQATLETEVDLISFGGRSAEEIQKTIDRLTRATRTATGETLIHLRRVIAALEDIQREGRLAAEAVDLTTGRRAIGGAPGRQHGGSVERGRPYLVGEGGPEIFWPVERGEIIAGDQARPVGGTGGATVNLTYSPLFSTASLREAGEFARAITPELVRELRRQGYRIALN
ncbi:MAG: hypothetical protein L0227_01320 [Chloroflexi bacterium]|nr:hypothetical protein [Chloroflexota bacterium]